MVGRLVAPDQSGKDGDGKSRIAVMLQQLEQLHLPEDATEPKPLPAAPSAKPVVEGPPGPAADHLRHVHAIDLLVPPMPDSVRIATGKLEALLRQAEEMLALKLTGAERLAELRQLQATLVQWEKEWHRISPDLRNAVQRLERPSLSSAAGAAAGLAGKISEFLEENHLAFRSATAHLGNLVRAAEHDCRTLGDMVDHLLADAKKLLMLPFSNLLTMFPKLVRDLCRDEDKQAELVMHGGEVEIDKRVLEEMKDPLIHLVRNCIDHGLERPEVRTRAGKPARGTLTLSVSQVEGNKVEVLVRDDGQGIDLARVRSNAVAQGVLSEVEARQLSDREAIAMIFKSGISTSPAVTEISGRGLGLAIVREKVERLGGSVAVETQPGQGAAFRLLLPLTLATFRGIAVRVDEQVFILPTADVERVLRVPRADVKAVENQNTVVVDGRAVSLLRLDQLLELPPPSRARRRSIWRWWFWVPRSGRSPSWWMRSCRNTRF